MPLEKSSSLTSLLILIPLRLIGLRYREYGLITCCSSSESTSSARCPFRPYWCLGADWFYICCTCRSCSYLFIRFSISTDYMSITRATCVFHSSSASCSVMLQGCWPAAGLVAWLICLCYGFFLRQPGEAFDGRSRADCPRDLRRGASSFILRASTNCLRRDWPPSASACFEGSLPSAAPSLHLRCLSS